MPIFLSIHKNSAFVTEKITSVHKQFNPQTNKRTKAIEINYDNGVTETLLCKTIKERDELFDNIIEAMKHTNYGIH